MSLDALPTLRESLEAHGLWALRHGRREEAVRCFERAIELGGNIPNAMGARLARHLADASA